MFPTSSTWDRGTWCLWIGIRWESEEGWKLQRSTSLEHIDGITLYLAVFDIKGFEVMVTWKRADEQSKEITQTQEGKRIMRWDVPNPTRMPTSAMFKRDILETRLQSWFHFPTPFLESTPIIFSKTSLKGITYACDVSFSFGQIQPSTFYNP